MKTTNTRLVLLSGLAGCAAWLGACQGQPNAGCPVSTSNPAVGLPPYWMKYEKISATGACGDSPGEAIGFQKYNTPGTKEIRMAFTVEGLGAPYADGRVDPNDLEGKNINGFSKLASIPNAEGYCEASEFTAPKQDFEAVPPDPLPDGGMEGGAAALSRKYEFQKLKFLATVNAPGTLFTGELKLTEDACTATFKTTGLWPQIACDPANNNAMRGGYNLDCDPKPDVDAGHILGSGINPTFAPSGKPITCGAGGYCEIQLTVEDVAKL